MAALAFLAVIDLGQTLGVGYIGVAISSIMYGVTCCQTFAYYRSPKCKSDSWHLKSLVAGLLLLDSLHQALIIHAFYYYLVSSFANPVMLLKNIWSVYAGIVLYALIGCTVNSFLVARIWRLSGNIFLAGTCAFLTFAQLVTNLVFASRGLSFPQLIIAGDDLKSTGNAALGVSALTDASIAIAIVYYLQKSRTGFRRSDSMITKLIALTITTGMLTSCFAIADLIAYLVAPQYLYMLFINFMIGKLYINTLLTSLNTRDYILGTLSGPNSTQSNSIPLSNLSKEGSGQRPVNVVVTHSMDTVNAGIISKPSYGFDV